MTTNVPEYFKERINETMLTLLSYQEPNSDNSSNKLFLTINVKIQLNDKKLADKIIKIQDKIISSLNYSGANLSGIYRYPIETLHFSLINFKSYTTEEFSEDNYYKKYKDVIEKLSDDSKRHFSDLIKLNNEDRKVSIGYIYPCSSPSIAFQAIPTIRFDEALKESCNKIKLIFPGSGCEIKSEKRPTRFSLNIVKFFRSISKPEYDSMKEIIDDKNKSYGYIGDITVSNISVVVSDNWLSNSRKRDKNISIIT